MEIKLNNYNSQNESNIMLCAVRPDLVDAGLSIPIGDIYIEKGKYQYRWINDNIFQIRLNGKWLSAYSSDFVFE